MDGIAAEEEALGYLLVGETLGEEMEDFDLAAGEVVGVGDASRGHLWYSGKLLGKLWTALQGRACSIACSMLIARPSCHAFWNATSSSWGASRGDT